MIGLSSKLLINNIRSIRKSNILRYNVVRCSSGGFKKFNKKKELTETNFINSDELAKYKYTDSNKLTNSDLINSNYGLQQFIKKTYLWTG